MHHNLIETTLSDHDLALQLQGCQLALGGDLGQMSSHRFLHDLRSILQVTLILEKSIGKCFKSGNLLQSIRIDLTPQVEIGSRINIIVSRCTFWGYFVRSNLEPGVPLEELELFLELAVELES